MEPYKKVCEYCKKEFTSRNITQKFCCSECRELYHKEEKKEYKKVCEYCGKEFIAHSNKAKYCSVKCKSNATDNRLNGKIQQRTCICCGKEYLGY